MKTGRGPNEETRVKQTKPITLHRFISTQHKHYLPRSHLRRDRKLGFAFRSSNGTEEGENT
jgi:hypothetical protein